MKVSDSAINALATAKSVLLDPWALSETDISRALGEIVTHHVDYADLYFQYSRSEGWSLEEGIVKTGNFSISQGVGVRAVSGEKTAFAYSDTLSRDALLSSARTVRGIARRGAGRRKVTRPGGPAHDLYRSLDPLASLAAPDKVALLTRVESMARSADPRVIQVMASLGAEYEVILIAGSDGRLVADVRPLVRLSLTVIAEHGGRREMGHGGGGGRTTLAYFTDEILRGYAQQAVHEALINLEARPAPAGEMTVVLGAGWPGILLHEAVGHGLEGDFNRKGSSVFSGRIGERVAAKGVTVVDDGTLAERRGSLNIDDEGNATQRNVLIEDGILKGYMQDSLNARLMKAPVTGNGRRESFAYLPMPRMTNTCMLAGTQAPEDIVASVHKGLYAVNFAGG
ncbi:MAG: metalloprotease TldD, partial [Candidimonas sp.]